MNNRSFVFLLVLLLAGVCAFGEGTRTWEQTKFDDFEKGTAKGIAIRSDGNLELAPAFKAIATTPSTYLWSIATDGSGNVYLAAGSPARVYAVTPDGKTSVIFEPQELQVQALVVDGKGAIYAATSPDGRVYRILRRNASAKETAAGEKGEKTKPGVDPNWSGSVFYEPKTKYIWALALDREGRLYVATGDHGEIYRVEHDGQGSLFFKSDEAHIRALALDSQGNLIAGSDGSGLVYRISPKGDAFVLYSAPKKEITALAVDAAGNIYAAAVGEKRAATTGFVPSVTSGLPVGSLGVVSPTPPSPGAAPAGTAPLLLQLPSNFPVPGLGAVGSEVYQIAPDGSPKRIWNSRDDIVYALGFDAHGQLIAGTGNKGRVLAIRGEQQFTDLLKASATQVTGFAKAPNGGLYVSTSNLGKVFLLGEAPETEGAYQSDVFDAKTFSRWGRVAVRGIGAFELWARSGNVDNPDRNWSPWARVDLGKGDPLAVPPARFVQWKTVLRPGNPSPQIDSVTLNYLPKNVAPVIDDIFVQVGARFPSALRASGGDNFTISVGAQPVSPPVMHSDVPMPALRDRESMAVRWVAHDDNDDQLIYSLYYRGDGETKWKLLKDKITDKFYSFDAGLLPDGGYTLKLVASDAPSNSPDAALTDERESQHFEVDTTPPRISDLNAVVEANELHITFRATDGFSPIKRAEYSLDAGEWQFIEPIGRISDARTENYDFAVPEPGAAKAADDQAPQKKSSKTKSKAADPPVAVATTEHLVVVRVWDRFDNVVTAKTVIHTK
jgi:sugar lactone lactonase YvrE